MLDLYEELDSLVGKINGAKIEYALCGSLALAVYGITRATVDIDVLVDREALPEILSITKSLG